MRKFFSGQINPTLRAWIGLAGRKRRDRQGMDRAGKFTTQSPVNQPLTRDTRLALERRRNNRHAKVAFPALRRRSMPRMQMRLVSDLQLRR